MKHLYVLMGDAVMPRQAALTVVGPLVAAADGLILATAVGALALRLAVFLDAYPSPLAVVGRTRPTGAFGGEFWCGERDIDNYGGT